MITKLSGILFWGQGRDLAGWIRCAVLFAASFVLATIVIVADRTTGFELHEFNVGDPAPRSLFAPFGASLADDKATEILRRKSAEHVPPVYSLNGNASKEAFRKLDHFLDLLQRIKEGEADMTRVAISPLAVSDPTVKELVYRLPLEEVSKQIDHLLMHYFGKGIFDKGEKEKLSKSGVETVTLFFPEIKKERSEAVADLQTLEDVRASAEQILPPEIARDKAMKEAVLEIFRAAAVSNLIANDTETANRRKKVAEQVNPVEVRIKKDELVVQRGMLVTPEQKWRIDGIHKKQIERQIVNRFLAVGAVCGLAYLLLFLHFFFYARKWLLSGKTLLMVHTILLLTLALSKIAYWWPGSSPYLMPTTVAPLLLVLLVHVRLGILSSVMMSLLIAPVANYAPEVVLATLVSGVIGSFVAVHLRMRAEFLRLGGAVGLSAMLVIFSYYVFREFSLWEASENAVLAMANGLLITMPLCFLLLPIFEWVFDIVTDISLLELSDLNHPLLKRMIVEAPGTYHHSLVVSSLAESACESIHANGLLGRVGAYFHDIGKIGKAQLFMENQANKYASKHDEFTPEMSCRLIKSHVRDGLELGHKYKLKDRILQFIAEHQGTGMIYYFYKKALDQASPGQTIAPEDYRYDGPKPQSREAAVVLLADSVEAASRALEDPTPESIRQLVCRIVQDKLSDGQLDESDLTFSELRKIEEVFIHNLTAIMHTRMSYPAMPEPGDEATSIYESKLFPKRRPDIVPNGRH